MPPRAPFACADRATAGDRGNCCRSGSRRAWRAFPARSGRRNWSKLHAGRLLLFSTWFDRSDPARPLFDPVTEGILKSKQLLSVSHDDGNTWSDWRELSTGDLQGCALTGPILRWDDGTIAVPLRELQGVSTIRVQADMPRGSSCRVTAGNRSRRRCSWLSTPSTSVYYWDQRLCTGASLGEFTALFWTHSLAEKRDLTVHLRHAVLTGESIDGNPICATPIPGQIAAPLRLADGRLLAFVVDRGRPGTMTLWCSHDGGETWPASDRLSVYTHDERAAITQGPREHRLQTILGRHGQMEFRASGDPVARRRPSAARLVCRYSRLHESALGPRPRRRKGLAMKDWIVTDRDRELFDRELDSFVPATLFDAHAHWYRAGHFLPPAELPLVQAGPQQAGSAAFDEAMHRSSPTAGSKVCSSRIRTRRSTSTRRTSSCINSCSSDRVRADRC